MIHYTYKDVVEGLKLSGVRKGDVVFSHSNVGYFGYSDRGKTIEDTCDLMIEAFKEVLGDEGTLVVPTFTYSFGSKEVFDLDKTPSVCGSLSEAVRNHPESVRSLDPMFSVAAIGKQSKELTSDISQYCFGENSFWDRFYDQNGLVCNLNLDSASTFIHYVEKMLNVPYRFDKPFKGISRVNGKEIEQEVFFFCRDLNIPGTSAYFEIFDELALKQGLAKSVSVGRGSVVAIRAQDTFNLIKKTLPSRPDFLTVAAEPKKTD